MKNAPSLPTRPCSGPAGYLSKADAAAKLGVSEKTLDRRLKAGDLVAATLVAGRRLWLKAADVEAYFRLVQERGYV